jgi:hypothetical protein
MSFPNEDEGSVTCYGFPETYLPALKYAIQNQKIKWGKVNVYIDQCLAEFEWAGATWEFEEIRECASSIRLIKGKPNKMDLTAAVLSS